MLTVSATIDKGGAEPEGGGVAFLYLLVHDANGNPLTLENDEDIKVVGWLGYDANPLPFYAVVNPESPIPGLSVWSLVPYPETARWKGTTYFAIEIKPEGGDKGFTLTQLIL